MATRSRRNANQAGCTLVDCRMGMALIGDVVQRDAAIGLDGLVYLGNSAKRGDHHRHLVLDQQADVLFQAIVRPVDNQVCRKRCYLLFRILLAIVVQLARDLGQPVVKLLDRTRVQGRECADDPRLALRDHQGGM